MKIFKVFLKCGIVVVVANDVVEAQTLLNSNKSIFNIVLIDDIELIEPFVVTGGEPSIVGWYQE